MNVKAKEALTKTIELFETTHWTSGTMVGLVHDEEHQPKRVYCAIGGLRYMLGFEPNVRPGIDDDGQYTNSDGWDEWVELQAYRDSLYTLVEVLAVREDSLGSRARIALDDTRESAFNLKDKYTVLAAFDALEDVVITFNDGEDYGGKDDVINLFKVALTKEFPSEVAS